MSQLPPTPFDAPVLIVGAGPVGQTAALLLARWGIPTIVLDDRDARDLVGSKAICQQRDVLDIWEAVGAGARLAAEGVTWTTARTFVGTDELFAHTFSDLGDSPLPPFVNISQARTEAVLDELIAANPLVDVRWGHKVTALRQSGGRVTADTSAGRAFTSAYALVCAGARCAGLRAGLGVTFDGVSFDDRFLICDIRAELAGWASERRFYFDPEWNPGRQVLIHPCPDSTFRIDWQVPSDFDLDVEVRTGNLDRRIRAIVGDQDYAVVWSSVYRFQSRCVDRMRVGRVLLAGDAAHLVAPFGARGLNSGVADAENAAWKLAYVLRAWASPDLLESYHCERHAAAAENLAVTTRTMNFLVPPSAAGRKIRQKTLERARTEPAARADVDSGRLAEPFWYVDSPLTTSADSYPFDGRPERGRTPRPGPGILLPDLPVRHPVSGAQVRLRTLARDGFLLLCCAAAGSGRSISDLDRFGPIRSGQVEALDPSGRLASILDARAGQVWIIRPDAYVAAVLDNPTSTQLASALGRAVGHLGADTQDFDSRKDEAGGVLQKLR